MFFEEKLTNTISKSVKCLHLKNANTAYFLSCIVFRFHTNAWNHACTCGREREISLSRGQEGLMRWGKVKRGQMCSTENFRIKIVSIWHCMYHFQIVWGWRPGPCLGKVSVCPELRKPYTGCSKASSWRMANPAWENAVLYFSEASRGWRRPSLTQQSRAGEEREWERKCVCITGCLPGGSVWDTHWLPTSQGLAVRTMDLLPTAWGWAFSSWIANKCWRNDMDVCNEKKVWLKRTGEKGKMKPKEILMVCFDLKELGQKIS